MQLFPKEPIRKLQSGNKVLSLDRPRLVGVLNVTPDSFSDGGQFENLTQAREVARQMIGKGVDWIDVGGESSGPGSQDVSLEEELHRVLPVIRAIREESDIWVSIDTCKAETARQAIAAGADVVNDVTALRGDSAMVEVVVNAKVPVILMYSKDPTVRTTTTVHTYDDVMVTIMDFLKERLVWSQVRGLRSEQVILDPGMGFFVSGDPGYSFQIIRQLHQLVDWGYPVMVGTSRKSFLANVSPGKTLYVHEREIPTAITASIALWEGASLVRLHDVAQGRLVVDTVCSLTTA